MDDEEILEQEPEQVEESQPLVIETKGKWQPFEAMVNQTHEVGHTYEINIQGLCEFATPLIGSKKQDSQQAPISSHFVGKSYNNVPVTDGQVSVFNGSIAPTSGVLGINHQATPEAAGFKQWLADQYNAGTPVIIVYPLATPTTETVTGQSLTTKKGSNTIQITQASINNLPLEVSYKGTV